jgi:exodeoxyribonuclease VII large subunit
MSIDLFDPLLASDAVFSVGDLNQHIKRVLQADPIASDVAVTGEISNFKHHSSGHCYFSLKDDRAQIRCTMWRGSVGKLSFRPSDGDKVICLGEVDFYTARGETNLNVREMHFAGQGALFEAFERLKLELAQEGLFEESRKKPLPPFPKRIGIITSPTGAVIRDILNVLSRRYPLATVVLIPAAVQGFDAADDLTRALSFAEAAGDLDVVIMARGGGSAEDLWCFNDEILARAVANFTIPLISAIGHETDYTILDFVADRRAPTPSAAAEIVAPDILQLLGYVRTLKLRAAQNAAGEFRLARQRLEFLKRAKSLSNPTSILTESREKITDLRNRLEEAVSYDVKIRRQVLEGLCAQLHALDPNRVLERGYAMLSDAKTGAILSSLAQVKAGQKIVVTLADGKFEVVVDGS